MLEIERASKVPDDLVAETAALGLFGIRIPEAYGGSGLSHLSRVLVHEMLGRTGFGFAGMLAAHTGIGSDALVSIGTEAQKRRYLPRMATGELRAAFALTEPEAGSDAGAVQTTARRQGDRYYLNGTKHFISGGASAGLISVVARTRRRRARHRLGLETALPRQESGDRQPPVHGQAMGPDDCHSPHAISGKPRIAPRTTCKNCHGDNYDVERIMPGSSQTAAGLFVRSHTFNQDQARAKTLAATGEPEYFSGGKQLQ